jgi:hypothetical protein
VKNWPRRQGLCSLRTGNFRFSLFRRWFRPKNGILIPQYHMVMANSLFRAEQGISHPEQGFLPRKSWPVESPNCHLSPWDLRPATCIARAWAACRRRRPGNRRICFGTRSWTSHKRRVNKFWRVQKPAMPQTTNYKYTIIEYIVNSFIALRVSKDSPGAALHPGYSPGEADRNRRFFRNCHTSETSPQTDEACARTLERRRLAADTFGASRASRTAATAQTAARRRRSNIVPGRRRPAGSSCPAPHQQGRHQHRQRPHTRVVPGPQNGPQPRQAAGWIGVKFLAAEPTSAAPRHDSACVLKAGALASRIAAAQTMVILTIFDTVYLQVGCTLKKEGQPPRGGYLEQSLSSASNPDSRSLPSVDSGSISSRPDVSATYSGPSVCPMSSACLPSS